MKRQWCVRRQTTPYPDGQQRWDRVYQLLLQRAVTSGSPAPVGGNDQEEEDDACCVVCSRVDRCPGPGTNH
jgi:hypothetical protein